MPKPAGYVGFKVPQQLILGTCSKNHFNGAHTPSIKNVFDMAASFVQGVVPNMPGVMPPPGFGNGFSFFEFIIELNNNNGTGPFPPAGTVLVAKETINRSRIQPCGSPPMVKKTERYEKFSNGIDIQSAIVGCQAKLCFTKIMEYAFIPDPAPGVAVPANENAQTIQDADLTEAEKKAFSAAVTLRLEMEWEYDNCNKPPLTTGGKTHYFKFKADTLDPNNGGAVTSTKTSVYSSN